MTNDRFVRLKCPQSPSRRYQSYLARFTMVFTVISTCISLGGFATYIVFNCIKANKSS